MTLDEYLDHVFIQEDDVLLAIKQDIVDRNMPAIFVPAVTGAALAWLIRTHRCRAALEIGALGGYSGVWIARALGERGTLTSLELRADYRDVAHANVTRAGLAERVTYRVGPAADSLAQLKAEGARFDFFFIDADKPTYPDYVRWALRLTRPGSLIVVDNVVHGGQVVDDGGADPVIRGTRDALEVLGSTPSLVVTALQTVGAKGYDGFAVALVTA